MILIWHIWRCIYFFLPDSLVEGEDLFSCTLSGVAAGNRLILRTKCDLDAVVFGLMRLWFVFSTTESPKDSEVPKMLHSGPGLCTVCSKEALLKAFGCCSDCLKEIYEVTYFHPSISVLDSCVYVWIPLMREVSQCGSSSLSPFVT